MGEVVVNYVKSGLGKLGELRAVRSDDWSSKKLERRILWGLERMGEKQPSVGGLNG